jgi:phosphoribosyl-dephospho-CoA transferase
MFERHKLVWLSERGWRSVLEAAPPGAQDTIDRWRQADWPAVVRRTDENTPDDQVCLGIALPPDSSGGKIRIPLRAAVTDVTKILEPVRIGAVIAAVPAAWCPGLAALETSAENHGLAIRGYGSLALQALTGQSYLTATTDIDLLFYPATCAQLRTGLDLLASHAAALPLDGEVCFPSGQAVAWKEFSNVMHAPGHCRVLVKDRCSVHLATTAALLHTLEDQACTLDR